MGVIAQPFGYLLKILYELFGNYGWALVFFTILVNLLMLPLTIKQQKSTANMQKIQPLIAEVQKKYQYDKEKQSQELMKVYQQHNINPMGGCLPLLIQLPIILLLYQVITKPLTYMYNLNTDLINELKTLLGFAPDAIVQEITLAQKLTPEILQMPHFSHLPLIDFNFYGLDLGATPSFSVFNALWLIPILAALTSYLLTHLTMKQNGQSNNTQDNPTVASMNTMNKIMPLISAWVTFSFPAGIGLYWIMSNVVRMAQQIFLNYYFKKSDNSDPLVIEKDSSNKSQKGKKGKKK